MRAVLSSLFHDWEKNILRPILVSVSTAALLVLASLAFTPVRQFLFPPDGMPDYPIYCVAEPYRNPDDPTKLNVDFFLINRTAWERTWDELAAILTTRYRDDENVRPDIHLLYRRRASGVDVGRVESASLDPEFNRNKGIVHVETIGNDIRMRIDHIRDRAVMKVTIVVADLPRIAETEVMRTARMGIPFDVEKYQIACHDR